MDLDGDLVRVAAAAGLAHHGTSISICSRRISSPETSFAGASQAGQRRTAPTGMATAHFGQAQAASERRICELRPGEDPLPAQREGRGEELGLDARQRADADGEAADRGGAPGPGFLLDAVDHGADERVLVHQQILGSCSPESRSRRRWLPMRVFSTSRPGSSADDRPDPPRALAAGLRADGGERLVHALAGHDREEAALAGDVERVEAQQLARALHLRAHRDLRLLEPDPDVRGDGDLAQGGGEPAARGVAEDVGVRHRVEQRPDRGDDRGGVGDERRLEVDPLPRRHHRDPVVPDRARHDHRVARPPPGPGPRSPRRARARCRTC